MAAIVDRARRPYEKLLWCGIRMPDWLSSFATRRDA
jgi:hypothetical protein